MLLIWILYSNIRHSILGCKISDRVPNLKTDLIISKLNFTMLETTVSGWIVQSITCGEIDSSFVVEEIWKPIFEKYCPNLDEFEKIKKSLTILADSIVDIVRLVEITVFRLEQNLKENKGFTVASYPDFSKEMIKSLVKEMEDLYSTQANEYILFTLLFPVKDMKVFTNHPDGDVNLPFCVNHSIYTNPVNSFLKGNFVSMLKPQGSLFRLAYAHKIFTRFFSLLQTLITTPAERHHSLKRILFEWFSIKMKLLITTNRKFPQKFTIGRFFGIDSVSVSSNQMCGMLEEDLFIPPEEVIFTHIPDDPVRSSLQSHKPQFLKELGTFTDPNVTFGMIRAHPGDLFDIMMVFRNPKLGNKPLIVFLDKNSSEVRKTNESEKFEPTQFQTVQKLLKNIPSSFRGDIFSSLREK
jgi:hypothetical protein